jgi:hypothetical protein
MNRTLGAARLYTVRPQISLTIPWAVGLAAFAVNVSVWAVGHLGNDSSAGTGGVSAVFISLLIVYVQGVTQTFPFAMAVGLSRHTFYAGTAVVALVQTVAYSAILTALTAVENATGGWGVGLQFWAPYGLSRQSVPEQFLIYASILLGSAFLGIAIGVAAKRWGATGLWTLGIAALLLLGGAAVLITGLHDWSAVGHWIVARSALAMALSAAGVLTVVSAGLSYAGLRRAVP